MKVGRLALLAAAILAAAAASSASISPSEARAARGLELGLTDNVLRDEDTATRQTWLNRARGANAKLILIALSWNNVAPTTRPAGFDPTNPADPRYRWESIDEAVRDATDRGFQVAMSFTRAPPWAEGPGRPAESLAPAGSWRPNPSDVGDFARALATRYSGNFMGLPAVRFWQLWAEPNLGVNLTPQFEGGRAVGFELYRPMLNAFYNQLKAVSPQNTVITGGTAPYGNLFPPTGPVFQRMQPLAFWRGLLCLGVGKGKKKKKKGKKAAASAARGKLIPLPCPDPARFDIAAHHPINVGRPSRRARNPDDISTPDIGKLTRVLRAAGRSGRIVPGGGKPVWATELYWNSNPPAEKGLPLKTQARFLEEAFYLLWKQGVQAAVWFNIRDQLRTFGAVPQSGLFFNDGGVKPAFTAFRFPFVTERLGPRRLRFWGIAPTPGKVAILAGKRRVKTVGAGANRVFVGILHTGRNLALRARQGSESSLAYRSKGKK